MRMKHLLPLLCATFICLSCSAKPSTPTPDLDATLETRMEQTAAAQPTATIPPTPTLTPTLSPTPTPSPTAEPTAVPSTTKKPDPYSISVDEKGWKHFTFHQERFMIGLPPHWSNLDLTADDYKDMLAMAAETNPELVDIYNSQMLQNMVAMGVKFLAVDTRQESLLSGFATNVSLLITDLPFEMELGSYVALNKSQVSQMLGEDTEVNESRITINDREAAVLSYGSTANDYFGEQINVSFLQYFMLDDKTQIILTFTTSEDAFPSNREEFENIAQSFQYGK